MLILQIIRQVRTYASQWFFECVRLAKPEIIHFEAFDDYV